ncbi:MAG: 3-hydroxyacyl-CoA dehydrogenase [Rhodospirillales bacterium]|nr:3-hydroxyacyl-CoA dehydrogenase [Rhodospirillales bacterium]
MAEAAEDAALAYATAAAGAAGDVPGVDPAAARPVTQAAVIGAGTMGIGIATALLMADLPVILIDPDGAARERASRRIGAILAAQREKGRIDAPTEALRFARLTLAETLAAAAPADLVIEAVFEDLALKQRIFAELDAILPPGAILASNTSTLDVNALAAATAHPGRVLGLHFFSPAHVMRLLEVVQAAATEPAVLASAMALARRLGKIGVVAGVCDGFIGNRLFEEYLRQVWFLMEEGVTPWRIDAVLQEWGWAMGPVRVMDLAGQDIGFAIRARRMLADPARPYSAIPDLVCALGRFGQKTGAGFYRYPDGRTPEPDPAIEALIARHAAALRVAPRAVADAEIVDRVLCALVNEGARALADGTALRAVDIDAVWLHGYGFPAAQGGPIYWADRRGLKTVLARMAEFAQGRHGWVWEPAPLLVRRAAAGGTLGAATPG